MAGVNRDQSMMKHEAHQRPKSQTLREEGTGEAASMSKI